MITRFVDSMIMQRFGKTKKAKEEFYSAKDQYRFGMFMLIIWFPQN